ncbi:thioesterase family protein [Amycolatopsis carbonis]|uniref:Thioesterase family protein n=1 Tax=Amycolatopsis carbonis TaxID=715471 RepID=A0A9Y2IMP3_9PSEU|nr:thioesterase family protein [Amycolatopsis sp. 2-15]WIX83165.1 thioesterase family protein [Amycolatopsis sp. 2-15]
MSHVTHIRPRWSDMDAFGHVNHAKIVTMLEEARIEVFPEAAALGLVEMTKGIVVAKLEVHYRRPVVVEAGTPARVEVTLTRLRAASLTLAYRLHTGPDESDPVAVTAETLIAPFDTVTHRPRRITPAEGQFFTKTFG